MTEEIQGAESAVPPNAEPLEGAAPAEMGPFIPVSSPSAVVLFHDPDGRMIQAVTCPRQDAALQTAEGATALIDPAVENGVSVEDLFTAYVDLTGEPYVRRRPVLTGFSKLAIAADDTDEAVLVLPEPFTAEIDSQSYLIDEPNAAGVYALTLTSPMPATYKVTVRHFPFLDYEAEITAS